MSEDNWETQEVITWLINNEDAYNSLQGYDADEIKQWVLDDLAPEGLYASFRRPPASSFEDVD